MLAAIILNPSAILLAKPSLRADQSVGKKSRHNHT